MDRRKKILFIQHTLHIGGAERVLVDILNNIDYTRYDVTLLLLYGGGKLEGQLTSEVKVISAFKTIKTMKYVEIALKASGAVYNKLIGKAMRRSIAGRHFDVAVSFMEGTSALMHYNLRKIADHNYTWVHCNFELFKWYMRYMRGKKLARFYSYVQGIAAVSDVAAEAFKRTVPDSAPVRTIYNMSDIQRVSELGKEKCDRLGTMYEVCIVGRLIPVKGHCLAIDAIKILRDRGVDVGLRIVGDGPDMDNIQMYASQTFGVSGKTTLRCAETGNPVVSFVGFSDNPYKYIAAADVLLIASESEGLGMTAVEAMALGKTVVSTDIDGPRELLEGGCGYLCPRNARDIADALYKSFDKPIEKDKALKRAGDFGPKAILTQIYRFLES